MFVFDVEPYQAVLRPLTTTMSRDLLRPSRNTAPGYTVNLQA